METGRWREGDEFTVLDLVARFEFKTPSSLSFQLSKLVDRHSPRLPEMEPEPGEVRIDGLDKWDFLLASGAALFGLGWLDVHHPCEGLHRLQLRVGLPDRYVSWESMRDLVPQIKAALGLPADEPYDVLLVGLSKQISTMEPWDRFVSTSQRQPPS